MSERRLKKNKPVFHVVKRDPLPLHKALAVRVVSVLSALLLSAIIIMALTGKNPLQVYMSMVNGAFGSAGRVWNLLQNVAMLLCVSLAVTPAFKMKFWNIGAEGQVLIGGLATVSVMMFLGGKIPHATLIILMILASVAASIIWAILPAIAKAYWGTNETLYTLMMNYVAIQLVAFFLKKFVKSGSGILSPMPEYGLPILAGKTYLLNILITVFLTIIMYIYLNYTKHGYEISVVGESENTARYIGINVRKVIIRTMILSGALAGISGLLLVGGTNHTISVTTVGGRGFTAIMVSWLGKFNPLLMPITSFLLVFLQRGAEQVSSDFRIPHAISDIVTGIILLFIIGGEFFLNYKLVNTKNKEKK